MVGGTWDLSRSDGAAAIELRPLGRLSRSLRDEIEAEAHRLLERLEPDATERRVTFSV